MKRLSLLALLFLSALFVNHWEGGVSAEEDLYKILGVSRTSTTKQIKSAYRRKALDTHPDKRRGDVSAEEASEAFHKVVHAFEVLSDEKSRRIYDQTGRTGNSQQQFARQGQQYRSHFSWQYYNRNRQPRRPTQMKDRSDVKQAMSRVMHIVSLSQLRTVMLNDDDYLERNLLMCFVTPQQVERIANDEMVFPYPFAARSSQGIWWEDMLQTVKIRYHNENELTRFFGVPHGNELRSSGKPIFLFGRRGQKLSSDLPRIQTAVRREFETWVWKRLEVQVKFVNQHPHPVEIYWMNGSTARKVSDLHPDSSSAHTTMLSHEFIVRDARVDTRHDSPNRRKLSPNSLLERFKITDDTDGQKLVIQARICVDLSGHCAFWHAYNECQKNPRFMKEQCKMTCGFCSLEDDLKYREELRLKKERQQELLVTMAAKHQAEQEERRQQEERQQQEERRQQEEHRQRLLHDAGSAAGTASSTQQNARHDEF